MLFDNVKSNYTNCGSLNYTLISDAFTDTLKRRIWKSMKITANALRFRYGSHKIYKMSLNKLEINIEVYI